MKKITAFKFKKTDQIGSAGAEEDENLKDCFVDTGELERLCDKDDHRAIVVGRTGTGKSALLLKLAAIKENYVISISPEALALTYVSNSTVLKFFTDLGVNLDPFFKLLWRHVLTVEILNHLFSIEKIGEARNFSSYLRSIFSGNTRKDKQFQETINYLENWGESFWLQTEYRVKEITEKVEKELSDELSLALGIEGAGVASNHLCWDSLAEEKKTDLRSRGQDIISKVQVKDLQHILILLDSVLADRQKNYFVIIDGLDENWIEERLRYRMIMALILNTKEFINKVENAKIIVALRRDLLERVFRLAGDSGFQEEKYESLYLQLSWTKKQILEVLDKRINHVFRLRYSKAQISHKDLLPSKFNKKSIGDYIFEMAPRPRDVIAFFNSCILSAIDLGKINSNELKNAEGIYSRLRLRALGDEWGGNYPDILRYAIIFQKRPATFKIKDIGESVIEEFCLSAISMNPGGGGILNETAKLVAECMFPAIEFRLRLIQIFYHIGLVGLKIQPHESICQVGELGRSISFGEITEECKVYVNPPYRRALGVI